MILVTGATGHFGKAAIHSLLAKGIEANQILALVRSEASATEIKKNGVKTVIGDYDDYNSLLTAFKGIDKLLFVSGNDLQKRMNQHQNVVQAAKEAGVKHVVYTSFQRQNESQSSPLWVVAQSHIQTEKWLKESGMEYTILRNNLYMDFLPGFIGENIKETGAIFIPAEGGKISAVLRDEMAEAAAGVLVGHGHEGKEYDFTHSEAVSYTDIANTLSEAFGKPIHYVSPSAEEYEKTLAAYGVPAEVIGIFSSFAVAQAQGELEKVSHDLSTLLGRKPISVKDFLRKVYASK